ncbi:hypothetical protein [Shewanella marina]|uniref:hypothetical protein n=1 Tax=Shewanella marina TaxID=487319 RepID=UPI0004725BD7|nr:hypothetical protein [Shewanella marina]
MILNKQSQLRTSLLLMLVAVISYLFISSTVYVLEKLDQMGYNWATPALLVLIAVMIFDRRLSMPIITLTVVLMSLCSILRWFI